MPRRRERIVKELMVVFPLLTPRGHHALRFGMIGPASDLRDAHPSVTTVQHLVSACTVNGAPLTNPTVAVCTAGHEEFLAELQALTFVANVGRHGIVADEAFGQRITITFLDEDGTPWIGINDSFEHAPHPDWFALPADAPSPPPFAVMRDFPMAYRRWDAEGLAALGEGFDALVGDPLLAALGGCLVGAADKETQRERSRIIIALLLYNQATLGLPQGVEFDHADIVLIAAAFEAMLNLPSEAIQATFRNAVCTLLGKRTAVAVRWCNDFYKYRSSLAHGDVAWDEPAREFSAAGQATMRHQVLARYVFEHCLRAKLLLMGLLPDHRPEVFDLERFVADWAGPDKAAARTN